MFPLLRVLVSLPLFSTQLPGLGAREAVHCFPKPNGYCVILADRTLWGGQAQTTLCYLDSTGVPTLSYTLENAGEPVSACEFSGDMAILCLDYIQDIARVVTVGGRMVSTPEFPGQFMAGGVITGIGGELFVAGNDLPGDSSPRLALIDADGNVVSNTEYPSCAIDVADMAVVNGNVCILGFAEQPGWQRDIVLFFPDLMEEYHYQPLFGRFTPVAIEPDENGCLVVSNAMTGDNGMVGEVFLLKIGMNMSEVWTASLSGRSWMNAGSSAATGEGIIVTGWTNSLPLSESNRSDLLLFEFSADGELLWTREYGGDTPDYGLEILTCSDGGFAVSGCTVTDLYQGWLLRTDSTGSIQEQGIQWSGEHIPAVSVLSCPGRNGSLDVVLSQGYSGNVEVAVIDMAGRIVIRKVASGGQEISFEGLAAGVYSILAQGEGISSCTRAAVLGGNR